MDALFKQLNNASSGAYSSRNSGLL